MIDSERRMSDNVTIFSFDVVVPIFERTLRPAEIADCEYNSVDRKDRMIVWLLGVVTLEQRDERSQCLGAVFAKSRTDSRIERHAAHDDSAFLILLTQSCVAAS